MLEFIHFSVNAEIQTTTKTNSTTLETSIDSTTPFNPNNSTKSMNTGTEKSPAAKECKCLNNGVCVNDDETCKCISGYYGVMCELVLCDMNTNKNDSLFAPQCLNGYCLRNTITNEYMCKCNPSHMGALCERPKCLDYCYNGGGCDDGLGNVYEFDVDSNKIANLSCLCPSGDRFYGSRCEFDKCFESNCSKSCWLDNNCQCQCNAQCDETFCNKQGKCGLDSNDKLVCK